MIAFLRRHEDALCCLLVVLFCYLVYLAGYGLWEN
jgi:hypothetical protein